MQNSSKAMNLKPYQSRYCVRTFRGYDCTNLYTEAEQMAKDMIMDIMTDNWSQEYWWAAIIDNQQGQQKLWSCPQVGQWAYTGWLHLT